MGCRTFLQVAAARNQESLLGRISPALWYDRAMRALLGVMVVAVAGCGSGDGGGGGGGGGGDGGNGSVDLGADGGGDGVRTFHVDFADDLQGWSGGFSDYPVGMEAFYEL